MAFWFPILFYLGRVRWETAPKKLGDEEKKAVLCLQNGNRSVLRWALPLPETGIAVPAAGFRPCLLSTGPPHQGNAKTRVDERSTPELDFLTRRAGQSDASALWSSEREPGAPPPTRRLRWLGLSQGLEFWSTAQQPRQGSILPGAPHRLGLALFLWRKTSHRQYSRPRWLLMLSMVLRMWIFCSCFRDAFAKICAAALLL